MKLYATTTSERATKGQGGNEYIHITLKDENQEPIFFIGYWGHTLVIEDIKTGIELYRIETKGKKKTGECEHDKPYYDYGARCSKCNKLIP